MTFFSPSMPSQKPIRDTPLRPGMAARMLDRMLPPLQSGRLQVILPNGVAVERPGAQPGPETALALRHWRALWRILLEGEDGLSDSYIDGDWTTPDLAMLLDLGVRNEAALEPRTKSWLLNLVRNRLSH